MMRNVAIIARKEMRDILRDRRALIFMIVLPVAIVPMLMFGMGRLVAFGARRLREEPSRVAVLGGAAPRVVQSIRALESPAAFLTAPPEVIAAMLERARAQRDSGAPPERQPPERQLVDAKDLGAVAIFRLVEPPPADEEAARREIAAKDLDAAVVVPEGFDPAVATERPTALTIVYDSSVDRSKIAHGKLTAVLQALDRGIVLDRLARRGIDRSLLEPYAISDASVASKEQEQRALLALILPYMLILMCYSGAVYPAIDLGAGEKERGTLETLLVSPAERSEIVIGKLLVTFTMSMLAAILNIVSLVVSLRSGLLPSQMASLPLHVDPLSALVAFVLMLPMAAIFASVLLSISIFAKSFKEAQAYFAPFVFLIILPAFFSAIPGVELNRALSLVPVVNVSLAIKQTLSGTFQWDCLGLIFASTLALAALCVALCTRWFKREEVLFRT